MADLSQFSIVTYERRPGYWRAAITPIRRSGIFIPGKTISSVVTPDDAASESDAKFAAEKIVRKMYASTLKPFSYFQYALLHALNSAALFLSDYLHPRHVVMTNGGRLSIIPNYFNRTPIDLAHRTAICHAAFPAHASANIECS